MAPTRQRNNLGRSTRDELQVVHAETSVSRHGFFSPAEEHHAQFVPVDLQRKIRVSLRGNKFEKIDDVHEPMPEGYHGVNIWCDLPVCLQKQTKCCIDRSMGN
jgi:hypothetical protein